MQVLEDDKVVLKPINLSFVTEKYLSWMNDPAVARGLAGGIKSVSLKDLENFITAIMTSKNDLMFAICDKSSGAHIGNIKLGNINEINRNADLGILIGEKSFWGRGYGEAVCNLVIDYGFKTLNLAKIWLAVFSNNRGALKLYRKIGFVEEGCQKKHLFIEGAYHDKYLMAIFNPDFSFKK